MGSYEDKTRVDSLEHVKALITRSMDLAEKYPSLSQEIYHLSTLDMICDVIPNDYNKGYNDFMNNILRQQLVKKATFLLQKNHEKKVRCPRNFTLGIKGLVHL